jgi:hypothetical protein
MGQSASYKLWQTIKTEDYTELQAVAKQFGMSFKDYDVVLKTYLRYMRESLTITSESTWDAYKSWPDAKTAHLDPRPVFKKLPRAQLHFLSDAGCDEARLALYPHCNQVFSFRTAENPDAKFSTTPNEYSFRFMSGSGITMDNFGSRPDPELRDLQFCVAVSKDKVILFPGAVDCSKFRVALQSAACLKLATMWTLAHKAGMRSIPQVKRVYYGSMHVNAIKSTPSNDRVFIELDLPGSQGYLNDFVRPIRIGSAQDNMRFLSKHVLQINECIRDLVATPSVLEMVPSKEGAFNLTTSAGKLCLLPFRLRLQVKSSVRGKPDLFLTTQIPSYGYPYQFDTGMRVVADRYR